MWNFEEALSHLMHVCQTEKISTMQDRSFAFSTRRVCDLKAPITERRPCTIEIIASWISECSDYSMLRHQLTHPLLFSVIKQQRYWIFPQSLVLDSREFHSEAKLNSTAGLIAVSMFVTSIKLICSLRKSNSYGKNGNLLLVVLGNRSCLLFTRRPSFLERTINNPFAYRFRTIHSRPFVLRNEIEILK